jgi:hypothetical protein
VCNEKELRSARIIVLGVAVIIVIGVAAAFLFGYLYAGIKSPEDSVSLSKEETGGYTVVCDRVVIEQYNATRPFLNTEDVVPLDSIAASIKKEAEYSQDPTCMAIIFWAAFWSQNQSEAQAALDTLLSLYDEGRFVNGNFRDPVSVSSLQSALLSMNKPFDEDVKDANVLE